SDFPIGPHRPGLHLDGLPRKARPPAHQYREDRSGRGIHARLRPRADLDTRIPESGVYRPLRLPYCVAAGCGYGQGQETGAGSAGGVPGRRNHRGGYGPGRVPADRPLWPDGYAMRAVRALVVGAALLLFPAGKAFAQAKSLRWPTMADITRINYGFDNDASPNVLKDWRCSTRTYDGHRGHDIGVRRGSDIFA